MSLFVLEDTCMQKVPLGRDLLCITASARPSSANMLKALKRAEESETRFISRPRSALIPQPSPLRHLSRAPSSPRTDSIENSKIREKLRWALERDMDISNRTFERVNRTFAQACRFHDIKTIKYLLGKGCNPEHISTDSVDTPLSYLKRHAGDAHINRNEFTDAFELVEEANNRKAVIDACMLNNVNFITKKWMEGYDFNLACDPITKIYPLMAAAQYGSADVIKVLIDAGASW